MCKMCLNCGTVIVCVIIFAILTAVAIYFGWFNVDHSSPEVGEFIKTTGDSIKNTIKDGIKKLD